MFEPVVVTEPPRADTDAVAALAGFGVATVHEAMGRSGLLDPGFRPIYRGARLCGTAVTALCQPGDNLMVHAAVEQCRPGDVLAVATASACRDGLFGELLATSLRARGVRGLVIGAGVRDVAELTEMGFPVWSTAISARGTAKATAGAVNVPIVLGGCAMRPGDVVVADDDGVAVVPQAAAAQVAEASRARTEREDRARAALAGGELGLDRYGLRAVLERQGVAYVPYREYGEYGDYEERRDR